MNQAESERRPRGAPEGFLYLAMSDCGSICKAGFTTDPRSRANALKKDAYLRFRTRKMRIAFLKEGTHLEELAHLKEMATWPELSPARDFGLEWFYCSGDIRPLFVARGWASVSSPEVLRDASREIVRVTFEAEKCLDIIKEADWEISKYEIAARMNVSLRTANNLVAKLVAAGRLQKHRRGKGLSNYYSPGRLVLSETKSQPPQSESPPGGADQTSSTVSPDVVRSRILIAEGSTLTIQVRPSMRHGIGPARCR